MVYNKIMVTINQGIFKIGKWKDIEVKETDKTIDIILYVGLIDFIVSCSNYNTHLYLHESLHDRHYPDNSFVLKMFN